MIYRVVRLSTLGPPRESEKLYAKINFRLLGKDLLNFKKNARALKDFFKKPVEADIAAAKTIGNDSINEAKGVISGTKKIRNFRDLREKAKQTTQGVKRWVEGEDGKIIADNVGTNTDRASALYERLLNYTNPAAWGKRYVLQLAKNLGVKDVASPTNPFDLIKKRIRQVGSVLKPKGELRQKLTEKANEFAVNPGGMASQEANKIISSGGNRLLDHAVNFDKIKTHVEAGVGNPVALAKAGLGMYTGDYLRTLIKTGLAAGDKLANRYITANNGKPIRLAARHRLASRRAGKFYQEHLKEPIAKAINTGTAGVATITGNPEVIGTMMASGAPFITGKTIGSIMNHSIQGVKKLIPTRMPALQYRIA